VAALITEATGEQVQLVSGGRGEFSVVVNDVTVAKKTLMGFPNEDTVVANVQTALG
jgi:hypothetical protein